MKLVEGGRRYGSAEALADDLERCSNNQGLTVRSVPQGSAGMAHGSPFRVATKVEVFKATQAKTVTVHGKIKIDTVNKGPDDRVDYPQKPQKDHFEHANRDHLAPQ